MDFGEFFPHPFRSAALEYNSCRLGQSVQECCFFRSSANPHENLEKFNDLLFLLLNVTHKVDWNLTLLFVANYAFVFLLHTACVFFIRGRWLAQEHCHGKYPENINSIRRILRVLDKIQLICLMQNADYIALNRKAHYLQRRYHNDPIPLTEEKKKCTQSTQLQTKHYSLSRALALLSIRVSVSRALCVCEHVKSSTPVSSCDTLCKCCCLITRVCVCARVGMLLTQWNDKHSKSCKPCIFYITHLTRH